MGLPGAARSACSVTSSWPDSMPYRRRLHASLLATIAFVPQVGCGAADPCGNSILERIPSPQGTHDVVIFERDCGATTGFTTQASVIHHRARFRERPSLWAATLGGNALASDDNHGAAPPGAGGGPVILARWVDETHLLLTYDPRARASLVATSIDGVQVAAQPTEGASK
jgi:hypothetical protein